MHQNLVIIIEEKHIYSYISELEMIICQGKIFLLNKGNKMGKKRTLNVVKSVVELGGQGTDHPGSTIKAPMYLDSRVHTWSDELLR